MMDGRGCALILGILGAVGFVVGLVVQWLGGPSWSPVAGVLALPVGCLVYVLLALAWHRIAGT